MHPIRVGCVWGGWWDTKNEWETGCRLVEKNAVMLISGGLTTGCSGRRASSTGTLTGAPFRFQRQACFDLDASILSAVRGSLRAVSISAERSA